MRSRSPHVPIRSRVQYVTLCRACMFLVGCCVEFVVQRSPNATISFIFSIFCRFICRPIRRELTPPCVPLSSHLVIAPPLITNTVFWLVVVCVFIFWDHIRSRSVFCFILFFINQIAIQNSGYCPPRTFHRGRISSQIPSSLLALFLVDCCLK